MQSLGVLQVGFGKLYLLQLQGSNLQPSAAAGRSHPSIFLLYWHTANTANTANIAYHSTLPIMTNSQYWHWRGIALQPVIALIFSSCALRSVHCAPAMFCSRKSEKRREERHWQPSDMVSWQTRPRTVGPPKNSQLPSQIMSISGKYTSKFQVSGRVLMVGD